jgi:ABC-2 type transport system ATP-binding protein
MIINKGKIVADGTTGELRSQAQGKDLVKAGIEGGEINEIFKALQGLTGVQLVDIANKDNNIFLVEGEPDKQINKAIFKLCVKNNWVLTQLIPVETKLEDIFKELTTK